MAAARLLLRDLNGSLAQQISSNVVALLPDNPRNAPAAGRRRAVADGLRQGRRLTLEAGNGSLRVLKGSLSARRVERQSPLLAGLHRVSTGVLTGLGLAMVGLSALSLHWQGVWSQNYADLQASRTLQQKLQESSALLEQHHLGAVRKPGLLVPTSSRQLIHLAPPRGAAAPGPFSLLASLPLQRIPAGY